MVHISSYSDAEPAVDWNGVSNWSVRRRTAFIMAASAGSWGLFVGVGYLIVSLV